MYKMAVISITRLLTFQFLIIHSSCVDWFVSHDGHDIPCGMTEDKACRNLDGVLAVAGEGDIIYVDGSDSNADMHTMCQGISKTIIQKPVKLVGYRGRPRIGCPEAAGSRIILEIAGNTTSNVCKVTFENLQIESGVMNITDCVIEVTNSAVLGVRIMTDIQCNYVGIFINQTTWYGKKSDDKQSKSYIKDYFRSHQSNIYCNNTNIKITGSQFYQNLFSIRSQTEITVYLSDSLFSNVDALSDQMGGLSVRSSTSNADIFIVDCVFEKQWESSRIGSLMNLYTSSLIIASIVPVNGSASGASVVLSNIKFRNNERGLVLIGQFEKAVINNCIFTGHRAKHSGAAALIITDENFLVLMNNCSFVNNSVGAIRHNYQLEYPNATVTYEGKVVQVNSSFINGRMGLVGKGGAIRLRTGKVYITNSTFINNTAHVSGGSIHADENTQLRLENSFLESNPIGDHSEMADILYSRCARIVINNVTLIARKARQGQSHDLNSVLLHRGNHWSMDVESAWVQCPPGYDIQISNGSAYGVSPNGIRQAHGVDWLQYTCEPCGRNTYSIDFGYLNYTVSCKYFAHYVLVIGKEFHDSNHMALFDHHGIECLECPYGGSCEDDLRAAPDFWGFPLQNGAVVFQHCPKNYCSSSLENGNAYTSCAEHRHGKLCGRCVEGYSDAVFLTGCVPDAECSPEWFWPFVIGWSLSYFLFLLFVTELKAFIFSAPCRLIGKVKELLHVSYFRSSALALSELNEKEESSECNQVEDNLSIIPSKDSLSNANLIMLYFYVQDAFLISASGTEFGSGTKYHNFFHSLTYALFTFQLNIPFAKEVCAFAGTTPVSKVLVQVFIVPFVLCAFALLLVVFQIKSARRGSQSDDVDNKCKSKRCSTLLISGFILAILLFFQLLSISTFKLLKCVAVDSGDVLFIDGSIDCFQYWQYGVLAYALVCVLPLCVLLSLGPSLMSKCFVQPWQFVFACILPLPFVIWWLILWVQNKNRFCNVWINVNIETKAVVDNLQGPFRENLSVCWLGILLVGRLVLVLMYVFILDDVICLTCMSMVLVLLLFLHTIVKPYKSNCSNFVGICFAICLVAVACVNLVLATFRSYNNSPHGPLAHLILTFYYIDTLLLIWFPSAMVVIALLLLTYTVLSLVITKLHGTCH